MSYKPMSMNYPGEPAAARSPGALVTLFSPCMGRSGSPLAMYRPALPASGGHSPGFGHPPAAPGFFSPHKRRLTCRKFSGRIIASR